MKIPIENAYYILCYAWRHVGEADLVDREQIGEFHRMEDLLGKVLAEGTFRLVRSGIDRGYQERTEDLAGIRGKLAMAEMAKRALRAKGRAACVFEELSQDVVHNRILRATLGGLLGLESLDSGIRSDVALAFSKLEGISDIRLDRAAFRRVQLDRNRRLYRFLLSICELLHESILLSEDEGTAQFRDFRRNEATMWKLFEDFVTEFYRSEQQEYSVQAQRYLPWQQATATSEVDWARIPKMQPDVVLDGSSRRIIVDAKFYQEALGGRSGEKVRSGHLYQVMSYLRNRQMCWPEGPRHEGVLLYPVVDEPLAVDVELEGFRVQVRGVDLGQPWERVHADMLAVLD